MPLRWDVEQVKGHKTVCFIDSGEKDSDGETLMQLNPITNAIIWGTITVKLGSITKKNAAEFFARFKFCEQRDGPYVVNGDGSPRLITAEDIEAHIGLVCNVVSESRAKFLAGFKVDIDRLVYQYEQDRKREEVAA